MNHCQMLPFLKIADNNTQVNNDTTHNINHCVLSYNRIKDEEITNVVLSKDHAVL